MTIQDAYNLWSASYDTDRNLTRDLDESLLREALAGFSPDTTLEIGCGTAKNTRFLAKISRRVLALDFSPGMIRTARARVSAPSARFALADLTRPWPVPPAFASLVSCNLVLEHIEDLRGIFTEAARALAPSGRFYIAELHPFRQYQGTKANFQMGVERIEIDAYVHHISDFLNAARSSGLSLETLGEHWHPGDHGKPPRILSLMFAKPG